MASFTVCYYHRKLNNQLFIWEKKKKQEIFTIVFCCDLQRSMNWLLIIGFVPFTNVTMIDFEVFYISDKSYKICLFLLNSYVVWALIKRPSSFIYISFSEVKCWCFITYKNKQTLFTEYQIRCSWFQWNLSWVPIFSQVSQYLPYQAFRVLWNLMI